MSPKDKICKMCGKTAPTKYVEFYQNIGMLIARRYKQVKGELCKECTKETFWKFTLTDLFLGWWGVVSMIVTPFYIINNVGRYLGSLRKSTL